MPPRKNELEEMHILNENERNEIANKTGLSIAAISNLSIGNKQYAASPFVIKVVRGLVAIGYKGTYETKDLDFKLLSKSPSSMTSSGKKDKWETEFATAVKIFKQVFPEVTIYDGHIGKPTGTRVYKPSDNHP